MRRRSASLMLLPLLMSLAASPTPGQSETSSTPEQIVSSIDPDKLYPGSAVRDALRQVIEIGQEETKRTAEEAVKAAVVPLKAENAQLRSERDGYKASWEAADTLRSAAEAGQQRAQGALPWVGGGSGLAGFLLGLLSSSLLH